MTLTGSAVRGVAAAVGCAAAAALVTASPVAADPCTASGLASTASGVLAEAGGYLAQHPGANDVLTAAATQSPEEARSAVRAYFMANPGGFLDLQRIAGPLQNLRRQCGVDVSPRQFATLFEALSE